MDTVCVYFLRFHTSTPIWNANYNMPCFGSLLLLDVVLLSICDKKRTTTLLPRVFSGAMRLNPNASLSMGRTADTKWMFQQFYCSTLYKSSSSGPLKSSRAERVSDGDNNYSGKRRTKTKIIVSNKRPVAFRLCSYQKLEPRFDGTISTLRLKLHRASIIYPKATVSMISFGFHFLNLWNNDRKSVDEHFKRWIKTGRRRFIVSVLVSSSRGLLWLLKCTNLITTSRPIWDTINFIRVFLWSDKKLVYSFLI